MKKFLSILLVSFLILPMVGCGKTEENANKDYEKAVEEARIERNGGNEVDIKIKKGNVVVTSKNFFVESVTTYYFDNDVFQKASMVNYYKKEENAEAFYINLIKTELFKDMKVKGKTVVCEFTDASVKNYLLLNSKELKQLLEESI